MDTINSYYSISMKRLVGLLLSTLSVAAAAAILFIVGPDKPADLTTDPLNPFHWADAAESEGSEEKFLAAAEKGPNVPAILIRVANFYVARGEFSKALPYLQRILSLTQAYNGIIFNYYLRADLPLASLIPPEPKQSAAFLYHLMARRHPEAGAVWQHLEKQKNLDPDLTHSWVNHQFELHQYHQAYAVWKKFQPFKKPTLLDWRFTKHDHVEVTESPLTLRFDGTFNSDFRHVTRNYVLNPGRYRLNVDWESARITTNEGPFVQVLDQALPPLLGTNARKTDHLDFVVSPQNPVAPVTIIRRPSQKFDNKIQGTLTIHKIEITPL
jgi:tetratricopeptide (TPR) repeat protein